MGLDMYLYARKYIAAETYSRVNDEFVTTANPDFDIIASAAGIDKDDLDMEVPSLTIEFKVGYWRKAQAIHNWFVDNLQNGNDNCADYFVSRDDLVTLRDIAFEVLQVKHEDISNDLLPDGYSSYDDDYYWQIEDTVKQLDRILDNPKFQDYEFTYTSSW